MNNEQKIRILFVDDEPAVLQILSLMVRKMSQEWDVSFVESGPEALKLMDQQPFDVLISDMRMPAMTGAQLLNEVMKRHPRTVRLILSGYADESAVMQCVGATHQWLTKPCNLTLLRETLARIHGLHQRIMSDEVTKLVGQMTYVPSMPKVFIRLLDALQSPDASVETIADIVTQDPSLTGKVLQLVNSAFFGLSSPVASVAEAVQLLGTSRIRSLSLAHHLFSSFDPVKFKVLSLEEVWKHSLRTAWIASQIVRMEKGGENMSEQAFTSGLLHDIGKIILAANLPDQYADLLARVRTQNISLSKAEQQVFKASHADVGAYLLGIWGLPVPLVEAVAMHHQPERCSDRSFGPLTAVHVANVLAQEDKDLKRNPDGNQIDYQFLAELGMHERLAVWMSGIETA